MEKILETIKSDKQIKKFSAYGFFKNLRFFEPYIILYLLDNGLNLLQIGLLYSIREITVNIFELPSGLLSDKYGNKKTLLVCFIFYIISFIFFGTGSNFMAYSVAMIFFGLGDAFRSGSHKAMIYNYLEFKNWFKYKTFVYGRTRSFSLLGSSISAIFSILLIFWIKKINFLFIISIIPYLIDFFLILSYPKHVDVRKKESLNFTLFFKSSYQSIIQLFNQKKVLFIVNSSAVFEAFFKSIKDYIQPILKLLLASITFYSFANFSSDEILKISLGLSYSIIFIFGSIASKNAHKLLYKQSITYWMNLLYIALTFSFILIAVFIHLKWYFGIIVFFVAMYIFQNLRRPFFVDLIGEFMQKEQRATVLSVENQLTSFYVIILAPIMGFLADSFGVWKMLIIMGFIGFMLIKWVKIKSNY